MLIFYVFFDHVHSSTRPDAGPGGWAWADGGARTVVSGACAEISALLFRMLTTIFFLWQLFSLFISGS
jgi:hypothetical protein